MEKYIPLFRLILGNIIFLFIVVAFDLWIFQTVHKFTPDYFFKLVVLGGAFNYFLFRRLYRVKKVRVHPNEVKKKG